MTRRLFVDLVDIIRDIGAYLEVQRGEIRVAIASHFVRKKFLEFLYV